MNVTGVDAGYLPTHSANSFDNWNLDEDERWGAIRINGDTDGVSVIGNALGHNSVPTEPPVRVIGAVTGSTIIGNIFDNTAGVLYAGTLGDGNYIERPSAGQNQHELLASNDGALIIRATGTDAPKVGEQAYGSFLATSDQTSGAGPGVKGGVRVVPTDVDGATAVEFLASTTDSNGVAAMRLDLDGLTPTADNVRDIGSAETRVRTVYAHKMQLNTVSATDLPAPAEGLMILVKSQGGGFPALAISDGRTWRQVPLGGPAHQLRIGGRLNRPVAPSPLTGSSR